MTARLLAANILELIVGLGFAATFDLPPPAGYLAGLALVGILSAHLALVHVTFGWTALAVTAAVSLLAGVARDRGRGFARALRPRGPSLPGVLTLVVLAAFLAHAWPAFATKPLDNYDAWAEWGMKAKALTMLGWADPHLFAAPVAVPVNIDYPLLLPSLEAVGARTMGVFDPRLIHLQFLLVAVAFLAALYGLLRDRVPAWVLYPVLVALTLAPAFGRQLLTAYADIPLACFVAAGLVASARWAERDPPQMLALATLFFAAAALTKKEGLMFAIAALVALLLSTRRWRPLLVAALGVEALLLPWQIWRADHHVASGTSTSWAFVHHAGIGPQIVEALVQALLAVHAWPLLLPLFLTSVLLARTRIASFAALWFLLSFVGLVSIYLSSTYPWEEYFSLTGYRVIDSLIVGATALAPLLLAEAWPGTWGERPRALRGRRQRPLPLAVGHRLPLADGRGDGRARAPS